MSLEEREVWLGLPWAPGYDVSSYGRLRSYRRGGRKPAILETPHLLKPTNSHEGYPRFTVWVNGRMFVRTSHRLALEAFVGPCPEGMVCRHLDGNPANNRIENLCWGTPKENSEDAKRHGTHVYPRAKLTEEKIRNIHRLREAGHTLLEISRRLGASEHTVGRIVRRSVQVHART